MSETDHGPVDVRTEPLRLPTEVTEAVGHYVYALRDPRNREVFYIGKGAGSRIYAHVNAVRAHRGKPDAAARSLPPEDPLPVRRLKAERIEAILADRKQVEHLFLRRGLPGEEPLSGDTVALMIEQTVLAAYEANAHRSNAPEHHLTNIQGGQGDAAHGLASDQDVIAQHVVRPLPPIDAYTVLVRIPRGYRRGMSGDQVYEVARKDWNVGADVRNNAKIVIAVAPDIVRGAYRLTGPWQPTLKGKYAFTGDSEGVAHLVGCHIRDLHLKDPRNWRRFPNGISAAQRNTPQS